MISVQTNVTSLIAQENLRVDTNFQSRTIQRLTSGYRINSSGDDPAGLAVANGYRNSEAELTQGIQNANDGISTLQIIDGGENNIGQILDRLKTLATQSASDTFNGSRDVLNSEFQGLVQEINRQAQSIGLNQNGTFARNLSVYIGGGRAGTTSAAVNSSLQFDLSGATVDAKSLGLTGMQAIGGTVNSTDIGSGSAHTTVADILSDANNDNTGTTNFYISGPGFAGSEKVKVSVNTQNVTDTGTLITAINKAIQNAGNNGTAAGTALQNANITATINTDSSGKQQLAFTSSTTAFQVEAGDLVSNALMGNFVDAGTSADASPMTSTVTGGENVTLANAITNPSGITMRFTGAGLSAPVDITLQSTDSTVGAAISDLQTQMATKLAGTGITLATPAATGDPLTFSNARGEAFAVSVTGDSQDSLGFGSFQKGLNGAYDYSTLQATANYDPTSASTAGTGTLQFSINGAASGAVSVNLAGGDATFATATGTALGAATANITTGTNDMFSLAVDGVVKNVTLTGGAAATSATATAGSVDFGAGGANTFNIHAATSGQEQGTAIAASVDTSTANQFTVSIDGGAAQTINLVAAAGQSQATIAGEITAQLGGRATAAFVSNKLTITSASAGSGSSIQIGAGAASGLGTGDATTLLGLDTTLHSGTAGNNVVNLAVDGGPTQVLTLTTGAARTGTQILADLNGTALGTIASLDTNNHLVLASTTTGLGSSIAVSAPPLNSADALLGITGAAGNTYHGAAATATQTLDSIAASIQTAVGAGNATVSVSSTNQIVIKAANAGEGHSVEILNGTANTALGFNTQVGTVDTGQNMSGAVLAQTLQQQFNTNATLQAAGLTASYANNKITVTSGNGTYFRMSGAATTTNAAAYGTNTVASGGNFNLTGNNTLSIGGVAVTLTSGNMTAAAIRDAINGTTGIGVTASVVNQNGRDSLKLVSNGTAGSADTFAVTGSAATVLGLPTGATGTSGSFGFGSSGVTFNGATVGVADNSVVNAGGSSATGDLSFTPLAYGSDSQVLTVTANDSSGTTQPMTITLSNNGATRSGRSIDETVEAINTALQQTNNATLQKITAVKDVDPSGAEKINFISSLASFQVSVGSTASGNGIGSQGTTVNSQALAGGSSLDISTQQGGTDAIGALTNAVAALGSAQANVGKAQNTLNYAIGLAESQTANLSAAESRIRDADMASEAANLTKAQVLQQSAIAAMVQANSAPQAVLTLLRG